MIHKETKHFLPHISYVLFGKVFNPSSILIYLLSQEDHISTSEKCDNVDKFISKEPRT